ncbi:hypothetical protein [Streptomyces sp. NPDC051776]|uniref:hypothetical protein n=1 Tax=Streptomyces sp. NPDC051776 TaxID=3155414 RepID=UPI00342C0264
MRARMIATATMVVLAMGGWVALGSGTAIAESGPDGTKARATGGSSTEGDVFQQNNAQSSRQNNNCNNPNTEDETVTLTGGRATGRCVTTDGSLTAFSRIHNGPADAEGGSSATASLIQQNTAQRGRQNNNCNNPNESTIDVDGGRVEGRCADQDFSLSKHTHIKGGGARVEGGSATSSASLTQQNIAQEGRQNNNCNNPNGESTLTVTGGRAGARCGNKDGSLSKHTHIKGGGARAEGGSSTSDAVNQQNVAQEGRQNNNCSNPNRTDITVDPGRLEDRCTQKDFSLSKHTRIKGGGARAEGGSSTSGDVNQQNVAQEGRQNNNCNSPNENTDISLTGGRVEGRCGQQDLSFSKHTHIKGGGARVEGGSSTGGTVRQQNTAQEGRQNNNCNTDNDASITVSGGRYTVRCGNKDHSLSKHTHIKGGGARVEGGSSTGGEVEQQDVAQEGRQNNNCANPNEAGITVTGGRETSRCGNKDHSFSKQTRIEGGGARVEGGSSTGEDVEQQNVAQEGRQNNNCANPNFPLTTLGPGRETSRCGNKDASFSKHTHIKGGGARVEGGSSTTTDVIQRNIAQEGRQNNNCHNSNEGNSGTFTVTGGRAEGRCGNKDASFSKHTHIKGGGARAEGGSSIGGDLVAQNIAQEGRQNNNCNSRNNDADITVTGGRVEARCGNKDFSLNQKTFIKGGGARAEGGSSTGGTVFQQNTAQQGGQDNTCNNSNLPDETIDLSSSRSTVGCKTVDGSANLYTADIGGGATAEGGSSAMDLFQQNTAQEGRQSNSCANPNNLTLTTTNSRTQTKCAAIDRSTNIRSVYR